MSTTYEEDYEKTTQKPKIDVNVEEQSLVRDVPLLDELHHFWILGEKEAFFKRLSRAVAEGEIDEKLLEYISTTLKGENLEKARKIMGTVKGAVKLTNSVGKGGVNLKADVKLIQSLLNASKVSKTYLKVDGVMGTKSIAVILRYQRTVVGLAKPDGKIDVGGKTFNALLHNDTPKGNNVTSLVEEVSSTDTSKISFGRGAKRVVSQKSLNVIGMALEEAGMDGAVITSTIRSAYKQASVMYKYAKRDLASQKRLYGATGDKVLTVFEANQQKMSKAEVIKLMTKRIKELTIGNKKVSRHAVSSAQYSARNVIDIGVNSTKAVAGNSFSQEAFTNALSRLEGARVITKFIDETKKVNTTWHVEIKQ
jgi:hypothetical protein